MFASILLFVSALVFLATILYAVSEVIYDSRPEMRLRRIVQIAPLVVVLFALNAAEVPAALNYITSRTIPLSDAYFPALKSIVTSSIILYITLTHSSRSERLKGNDTRAVKIAGWILGIVAGAVFVALTAGAMLEVGDGLGWLYTKSYAATWVAAASVFTLSFVAVYSTVYSILNSLPFRWLAVTCLIMYYGFFLLLPPVQIRSAAEREAVSWLDALRPLGLIGAFVASIVPITVSHSREVRMRHARNIQS